MRVLFSAASAKSGGAATYVANLVRELQNAGDHFVFVVPVGTRQRIKTSRGDIEIIETDIAFKSPVKRLLWDQWNLRWLLRRHRIDVLVSTSDFGLFFSRCPQILLVRNSLFFSKLYRERILIRKRLAARIDYWLRRFLVRASIGASDLVVTASEAMLSQVVSEVPGAARKSVVNTFGAPLAKFFRQSAASAGDVLRFTEKLRLLYVSEYADYKSLATVLKAVKEANAAGSGRFMVTVTMDPRTFKDFDSVTKDEDVRLATELELAGAAEFVGSVPYDKIEGLYAQCDVFVFPSMAESFGHPLVEAMASEIPIVASDIPVHREVCGEAAVYFDPGDHAALAACIRSLQTDIGKRRRLAELGGQHARSLLSWPAHVRRLEGLMRLVAARGKAQ